MPDIQLLPPSVINKIAAGEVIERPASVVKELVENALDAGATRVDVAVEQGGLELIRVSDNGCGILPEQLPLAVSPHATSKIRTADDLFRVATLGFRGEALASIASVSHLTLRSRAADSLAGAELSLVGGEPAPAYAAGFSKGQSASNGTSVGNLDALAQAVAPCGCPVGTTVEVRNLFFNTPVRRKFLKAMPTELGHVTEALTRLALAHPRVHFTLRHNGCEVHDLPPTENWLERIGKFFGDDLARDLIWVENRPTIEGLRLFGYVGAPTCSRPHTRLQYLFLNGRAIRDRALQHALAEAYRGLLLTGRHPVCFLCLEMPPNAVDVNVHPTKLEVRFQDGGRVYSQFLGTLRTKFLQMDLTARWQPPSSQGGQHAPRPIQSDAPPADAPWPMPRDADQEALQREFVAWAKGELARQTPPSDALAPWERDDAALRTAMPVPPSAPQAAHDVSSAASHPSTLPSHRAALFRIPQHLLPVAPEASSVPPAAEAEIAAPAKSAAPWDDSDAAPAPDAAGLAEQSPSSAPPPDAPAVLRAASDPQAPVVAMQVHDRYLITESDEGVVVIDQHALHERILYEQLRQRVLSRKLQCQNLLVPEPVDLSAADAALVLQHRDLLAQLGLRVEPFGGSTVLVCSYPAMLARANVTELLRGAVERLAAGDRLHARDLLDELLHMMACKAAIKAGDRLAPQEIAMLLAQRHLAQDSHHCPHGRPTALVLTCEALDRQFLRT